VTRAGLWLRVANTFMDQGGKRPRATREARAHRVHHSGDASTTEQDNESADESHPYCTEEEPEGPPMSHTHIAPRRSQRGRR